MNLYTDASTRHHSGIAFILTDDRDTELLRKAMVVQERDNNTAELLAILLGLEEIKGKVGKVKVYTDSTYALGIIFGKTCRRWEKGIVSNIRECMKEVSCEFIWIKGHSHKNGMHSYYNREADSLANHIRKQHVIQKRLSKLQRAQRAKTSRERE